MKTTTCGKIIKKKDVGKTGGLIINNFCKNDFCIMHEKTVCAESLAYKSRRQHGESPRGNGAHRCRTKPGLYEAQEHPRRHGNALRVRERRAAFVLDERYAASAFDRLYRFERSYSRHIRYDAVQSRARQKFGERSLCTRSASGMVRSRRRQNRRYARPRFRYARTVGKQAVCRAQKAWACAPRILCSISAHNSRFACSQNADADDIRFDYLSRYLQQVRSFRRKRCRNAVDFYISCGFEAISPCVFNFPIVPILIIEPPLFYRRGQFQAPPQNTVSLFLCRFLSVRRIPNSI